VAWRVQSNTTILIFQRSSN